jgi:hypothetical protein
MQHPTRAPVDLATSRDRKVALGSTSSYMPCAAKFVVLRLAALKRLSIKPGDGT